MFHFSQQWLQKILQEPWHSVLFQMRVICLPYFFTHQKNVNAEFYPTVLKDTNILWMNNKAIGKDPSPKMTQLSLFLKILKYLWAFIHLISNILVIIFGCKFKLKLVYSLRTALYSLRKTLIKEVAWLERGQIIWVVSKFCHCLEIVIQAKDIHIE